MWAITAGVYLALMGPQGMAEVGEAILRKTHYAIRRLATIEGLRVPLFRATPFQEFVVNFDASGKTVKEINKALLVRGIFGGKDISREFPELGQSALFCVTEVISKADIDRLISALKEIL